MNLPDAPFLELGFYFADKPETVALADLLHLLTTLGGECTGEIAVHLGDGIRDKLFASITEQLMEERAVADLNDLVRQIAAPNQRIIQIGMHNATGISPDLPEIVTYLSISSVAMPKDRHPLAIWTEGWMFSGPPSFLEEHSEDANRVGQQVYQRFCWLVEALNPAYATITIERSLECPVDLRNETASYVFTDFFVRSEFLDASKLKLVRETCAEAYVEQLTNGLYISSNGYFNPAHISVESTIMLGNSIQVAKLLAY